MIEYITLSDLVKKVSQDAVEKGKEIFNTKKIREKYLNIFEIIEKKFSQQNKVLEILKSSLKIKVCRYFSSKKRYRRIPQNIVTDF